MIHQPMGGAQGQASDIEITAREIMKLKKELYEILAEHSGKSYQDVYDNSDRDYWMRAEEAKEYGLIDEVLHRKKKSGLHEKQKSKAHTMHLVWALLFFDNKKKLHHRVIPL
jgi:ATP-dependent protease ClpP protease subunit